MWVYRDISEDSKGMLDTNYEIGYYDEELEKFVVARETRTKTEAEKIVSRLNGGSSNDVGKLVVGVAAVALSASYVFFKRAQKINKKRQRRLPFLR